MAQPKPQSLDEIIETLKTELSEHAAAERARITAEADAAIANIRGIDQPVISDPVRRAPRRFDRQVDIEVDDVPPGALLVARRMADEGHSRHDVAEFLADSFKALDVELAVSHAFHDVPA